VSLHVNVVDVVQGETMGCASASLALRRLPLEVWVLFAITWQVKNVFFAMGTVLLICEESESL